MVTFPGGRDHIKRADVLSSVCLGLSEAMGPEVVDELNDLIGVARSALEETGSISAAAELVAGITRNLLDGVVDEG